jgi:hypothetical protein
MRSSPSTRRTSGIRGGRPTRSRSPNRGQQTRPCTTRTRWWCRWAKTVTSGRSRLVDLRISTCDRCGAWYGVAMLECPSCLTQDQREVASFGEALLRVGRRIDHRRHMVEEVGFIAVSGNAEEGDRPRSHIHRANTPKELILSAV